MTNASYVHRVIDLLIDARPTLADRMDLTRLYALLVLAKGEQTTAQDAHDAWALWRDLTQPTHPDLVPFASLPAATQDVDQKYVAIIHTVARAIAEENR